MRVGKRFKPITAVAAAVCLLAETIFVGAAQEVSNAPKLFDVNVEYISASSNLVFSGTMAKKKTEVFNIAVAAYGKDVSEFASDASEEIILKTSKTGGGGEVSVVLELPDDVKSNGRNAYHIFGSESRRDGVVFTLEHGALDEAVNAVNSGAADSVAKIAACPLNDGKAGLASDSIAQIAAYVIKAMPLSGYTEESLAAAYLKAEGFLRAKSGSLSVEKCADEYSVYIGKDLWTKYSALSTAVKQAFETALKNYTFGEVTDENKIYDELVFVAESISAESSAALQQKVIGYFKDNSIDLTSYNNLPNDTRREAAFEAVYAERATIKTLGDIKALLAEKVAIEAEKAANIDDKINNGGSTGGGGGVSVVTPATPTTPSGETKNDTFGDMTSHWAKDYAAKLFKKGIINGFPDGSFQPEKNITRAEFAKMAVSALGLQSKGADLYSDVTSDSWYYAFVAAATEAKLINGDGNEFLPDRMITRQDAAAILARAIIYKKATLPESAAELSDLNDVADYARDAVKSLCGLGIVTGDEGAFRPLDSLTRAEASALFVRLCDYLDGDGKLTFEGVSPENFKIVELPIKLASLSMDALAGTRLALSDAGEQASEPVQTVEKESAKLMEAKAILAAIADGEEFFDENCEDVTRGEFLHALLSLTKQYYSGSGVQIFSDVSADHKYADDVKCAVDLKIISRGDTFRPDDVITANEAAKLMVASVGYSLVAENRGGYPTGYRTVAMSLDFIKGVSFTDETVSGQNAVMLLFNLLSRDIENIGYADRGNSLSYTGGKNNLLNSIYNVYSFEGLVTAVGNHSVTMNADYVEKENYVELDGVGFELEGVLPDMLGKKVTAYVRDDGDKELICISEKDNDEISIRAKDFEDFRGGVFRYYDGDRNKTLNMDSAYKVIYNGRRISAWDRTMADEDFTRLRFLDNDGDRNYEILFVDTYSYGILNGVDYKNMSVGIKLEKKQLDLSDSTSVIEIYNSDGEDIDLFRLESGMTVAIKEAADKKFYQIHVCSKTVSGNVRQINSKDNSIRIDDEIYSCSTYFCNKYIKTNLVGLGQNISVVLGMDGEVTELSDITGSMKYAYLISCAPSKGLKEKAQVRLYSSDGEMKVFEISDKTQIDGAGRFDGDEVCTRISANTLPYVIRYSVDSEGEINSVDFAETPGDELAEIRDPANSLRKNYSKQSLTYRSGCLGFNSYALLKSSIVMFVPEKAEYLTDEERYQIGTYSLLNSNSSYPAEIYDIDENGNAGLAVVFDDFDTDLMKNMRVSYIVESVNECIKDGETMRELVCYGDKAYTSLYLPDDVTVNKTSGNDIVPGDIIRCRLKDDQIQGLFVDFDFSSGKHVFDSRGGANFGSRICNSSLEFLSGKVYSIGSGNLIMSNTTNSDGEYSFTSGNLMPYSAGNAEIVCYDKTNGTVTPIDAESVHGYLGYGDDADFVIIRQGDTSMKNIYIVR